MILKTALFAILISGVGFFAYQFVRWPVLELVSSVLLVGSLLTVFVYLAVKGTAWCERMMSASTIYGPKKEDKAD